MRNTGEKIGVILGQVGSPESFDPAAVRKYLARFLSDKRIVDYPSWLWYPILYGIILNTRPRKSAKMYQKIWTPEGSPLVAITKKAAANLENMLGDDFNVIPALAYTDHDFHYVLKQFSQSGITKIICIPQFPQFSSTTTGSVNDDLMDAMLADKGDKSIIPAIRTVSHFYEDDRYLEIEVNNIRSHISKLQYKPDKIIFSFHGLPQRYIDQGDPYLSQCIETTKNLASKLGLHENEWILAFQSKLGPEEWIGPNVKGVLANLAKENQTVLVISPGFVTDCLETLYEIDIELLELYKENGGDVNKFSRVKCLNDNEQWIKYLSQLIRENTGNWI